ncbi:hypothetical protein DC498_25590 [Terrimonas sp.]|uniref:hypothetical protein n=1 Tax=Terrimonas sp. TaxID=1914338 RepID=UPI000D521F6D|nr:hypothetical protein [Terrimonas sp.]PVD49324.1 hypothetical protein DC498_25590 [Terrimonas sp.]
MKEVLELRINYDYAHLLFKADEGKNLGTSVKVVEISKEDPRYSQVPIIAEEIKKKYDRGFFFGWQIKRRYSKKELDTATLLHLKIKAVFEPTGEECGTLYDETAACEICGANRKQASPLILKKGTIPKKDIARTIGGEVVVSEKFVNAARQRNLKGLQLSPINVEKYYQLTAYTEVELSHRTVAGVDPWDFSEGSNGIEFTVSGGYPVKFEKEVYKCPKGDTIGLNLLSEPYVLNSQSIGEYDFFASKQKIGVKRGLLRPEPIYFCSPAFRKMIEEEKLSGFEFEITNIE